MSGSAGQEGRVNGSGMHEPDDKKKVLAVSYCLPPLLNAQSFQIGRLLYYASSFCRFYAVTADDPGMQKDPAFYGDLFRKLHAPIVVKNNLVLGKTTVYAPGSFWRWHRKAFAQMRSLWKGERFDVIATFAAPMSTNMFGLTLKKHYGARWVAFISDPWVDNAYVRYRGLKRLVNAYYEAKVMRTADTVVFTCPETLAFYVAKYPFLKTKATFLEHSYDETLYPKETAKSSGLLLIRHIGALYGRRTIEPLFTVFGAFLRDNPAWAGKIRLEHIGVMPKRLREQYDKVVREYGLEQYVTFQEYVPYRDSLGKMNEADVLVVADAPIRRNISLLCKLIDYIGAGRPVLAVAPLDGATARVARNVGGWVVEPGDVQGMEKALREIVELYRTGALGQRRPSEDEKRKYSIERAVSRFREILEI